MIILCLLLLFLVIPIESEDLVAMGCERDSTLPYCAALASRTHKVEDESKITEKDKQACSELRMEYVKVCAMSGQHKTDEKEKEFCQAFENICFRISEKEPDRESTGTQSPEHAEHKHSKHHHHIDFTRFCKEFKNRYLFVCPDPFRFGQKAVVFCPIYSERCNVPLPDHPVVPTRKPPHSTRSSSIERLCRSYRNYAESYCNNPFTLSQPQYRQGCERYWKFCTRSRG